MASGTKRIAIHVGPTVLIADDEEAVRTLAATTLEQAGFLVLPACNAEAAIEIFRRGRVNVDALLTDVQMGNGITGIALAEHILNEKPEIGVLVMSGLPEAELLASEKNLRFLAKPFAPAKLVEQMRQALTGEYLGATEIPRMRKENLVMMPNRSDQSSEAFAHIGDRRDRDHLTDREIEVVRLVAEGCTTKEIAARLQISFKKAAFHRSRIMSKLGARNGALLVRYAIREGFVQP